MCKKNKLTAAVLFQFQIKDRYQGGELFLSNRIFIAGFLPIALHPYLAFSSTFRSAFLMISISSGAIPAKA